MKITKKQKAYLAGLAVGLAALAVDRTFLAPAEVQAETGLLIHSPAAAKSAAAASPASLETPASDEALAEQLRAAAARHKVQLMSIRNAFTPSPNWAGQDAPHRDPTEDRIDAFRQTHRLAAVMVTRESSQAIINGNAVKVGQTLDGFVLESLSDKAAVFRSGKARVQLILDPRNQPTGRSE
jgi:hypothetical protein